MNYTETVMSRHAAKSFDDRCLTDTQINDLMEIIRHSPTSYNLQPWVAKVIRDAETKEGLAAAAYNQPQIASCSHLFVFCANIDVTALINRLEKQMMQAGTPAKSVTGFVEMLRPFESGLDATTRLHWAQRQVYIALANGVNGAKALGFDSCPMEGFDPEQFAAILDLPSHLVPTVLMPVGYASDSPRPKLRFSREDMFF